MKAQRKKNPTIGMVTIGQSPRTDVLLDIRDILGLDIDVIECGALDGLSMDEIDRLKPSNKDDLLISRMSDGSEVRLSHQRIIGRMQECIDKLQEHSDIHVLLCTGEFPELYSAKLLIKPSLLIRHVVMGLLQNGKLGVLIPSPEQLNPTKIKWKHPSIEICIESLSPYPEPSKSAIKEVALNFRNASVDLIILDCIGYNLKTSKLIKRITSIPTILSRTLLARSVKEII